MRDVKTLELSEKDRRALLLILKNVSRDIEEDLGGLSDENEDRGLSSSGAVFLSEAFFLVRRLEKKLTNGTE